jgi:hypothetical protein
VPGWIRPETLRELEVPERYCNAYAVPLDPTAANVALDPIRPDLRSYFGSGGELLHQANRNGDLELFVMTDTPHEWRTANWGIQVAEAANNRLVVELVVYDDPESPLLLPFIFSLADTEARYNAAALCEQPVIPVFVLTNRHGHLLQAYCREITLPAEARSQLRSAAREARGLRSRPDELPPSFPDPTELSKNGTVYEYAAAALRPAIQQTSTLVLPEIRAAVASLAEHRNSGLRKGPFILWACLGKLLDDGNQWVDGFTYFVSPLYEERARGRRSETEPLYHHFKSLPGFIRTEHGGPLHEGAIPLLRFAEGQIEEIPLTPGLIDHLAAVFDQVASRSVFGWDRNHYRKEGFLQGYTSLLGRPTVQRSVTPQETLAGIRSLDGAARGWVYGFYRHLLGLDLDAPYLVGIAPSRIRVGADRHEAASRALRIPMEPGQRLSLATLYLPKMDTDLPGDQIVLEDGAILTALTTLAPTAQEIQWDVEPLTDRVPAKRKGGQKRSRSGHRKTKPASATGETLGRTKTKVKARPQAAGTKKSSKSPTRPNSRRHASGQSEKRPGKAKK